MTDLDVHARKGDPASSDRALRAIAKNGTMRGLIIEALVCYEMPVSDDDILSTLKALPTNVSNVTSLLVLEVC
jgi:hypothetical protein